MQRLSDTIRRLGLSAGGGTDAGVADRNGICSLLCADGSCSVVEIAPPTLLVYHKTKKSIFKKEGAAFTTPSVIDMKLYAGNVFYNYVINSASKRTYDEYIFLTCLKGHGIHSSLGILGIGYFFNITVHKCFH